MWNKTETSTKNYGIFRSRHTGESCVYVFHFIVNRNVSKWTQRMSARFQLIVNLVSPEKKHVAFEFTFFVFTDKITLSIFVYTEWGRLKAIGNAPKWFTTWFTPLVIQKSKLCALFTIHNLHNRRQNDKNLTILEWLWEFFHCRN